MKLKSLVSCALVLLSTTGAFAADQSVAFNGDTASFIGTAPLLDGGDDVISFTNLAAGQYDFLLTLSGQYINLTGLSVNGVAGTVISNNKILFADVEGTGTSPFELTLNGTTLNTRANYSGEISATAVPEPASSALLLAGLMAVGLAARRRRSV
jgi:hypothetical protein